MKAIVLDVQKREVTGKKVREQAGDNVPAVMYGNGIEAGNLWVNATTFKKVFDQSGTNTVIALNVDGKKVNVLVYDYQLDSISDEFTHIDFYAVDMKATVEAEVPLVFVGISAAVKELGGTLVRNNDTLVVKALPADLPHEIEVDLAGLVTFDDNISVSDVTVSDNVEIILDANATIASVAAPRSEEEMAELDSEINADVSGIEGVADKDEDGEAGEEGESKDEEKSDEKTEEK